MKTEKKELEDFHLPTSEKIERQVITDAINNPGLIGEVAQIINEDSFTNEARKLLWREIMHLFTENSPVDMVSIFSVAGDAYSEEILAHTLEDSLESGFISHAQLLKTATMKRRAYFAALEVMKQSVSPQVSEDEILSVTEKLTKEVQGDGYSRSESPLNVIIDELKDETELEQKEALSGRSIKVATGITPLDYVLFGGFGKGQLIILAARPSVGKTAVMLQFARHAAETSVPAMIFSLEMTRQELGKRLLFSTGKLSQEQFSGKIVNWGAFEDAKGQIENLPITINDEARTPGAIAARITAAAQKGQCGIAFIDYLGLMRFDLSNKVNFATQIGFVTGDLKALAKRLRIPIVLLVQLNREFPKEGDAAPQLHHLKDSGSIEQDADCVLMLANGKDGLDLWVRKNRSYKKDLKITLSPNESYSFFTETNAASENDKSFSFAKGQDGDIPF